MCVTITPGAARFVQRMVRLGGMEPPAGLRLSVKPGGYLGFDSSFTIEAIPEFGDTVVEQEGVTLFLPQQSCELLRGCTIDYSESRLEGGFVFRKPGAAVACGCGSGGKMQSAVAFHRSSGKCSKT